MFNKKLIALAFWNKGIRISELFRNFATTNHHSNMKQLLTTMLLLACLGVAAQTNYDLSKLATERLDRGVIATRQADGKVFVSWRILRDDQKGEPFDVYRNGQKLNTEPLTEGGSWFVDEQPLTNETATYEVRGGNASGTFSLPPDAPVGYFTVKLEKPEGGQVPSVAVSQRPNRPNNPNRPNRPNRPDRPRWHDDGHYHYSANDATVADVDGDGQLELILKWDPSNARDNAHDGYTGPTLLDCYKLSPEELSNSKLLWRINLGQNIRSGAHYTQFIAYDLDGDGRAELMVKTADGTRDGKGRVLLNGTFVSEPLTDTIPDYRNAAGHILDGPEYITVFSGLTGEALDTKPYIPDRGEVDLWGDTRGNRSERYLAGVGYLGVKAPRDPLSPPEGGTIDKAGSRTIEVPSGTVGGASAIFCRGYYTRTVIAAWDWDGHELSNRWTFDTNDAPWQEYAGQGNHNLRIADVDGDGMDEITYGSMAVDHDGRGLYNTSMGHGDAIHLLVHPTTNELYIWDCHENKRDGSDLRHAATGKVVFQIKSKSDVGRALAADIDPTNPGMEMWSTDSHGIRNMQGDVVCKAKDADDPQHNNSLIMNGRWLSINFGIWWDGDLLRELLDKETVSKYDWEKHQVVDLQKFDGRFNNGTKSNPCLSADILGDWREEVIIRNQESTELRIYSTTIPTPYRINCLLQDIPYRLSVATENVGYNQPPEPGFYLGPDRTDYLK